MPQREVPIMLDGLSESERTRLLSEMSEGYAQAGRDAEERRIAAERAGDASEEKTWHSVVVHCEMMAALVKQGVFDEPNDTHLSFYAFDERIGDKKLLLSIMADVDAGREVEWTPAHQSVLGAAMYRLTPKQREIASLYYIGRVARKNLPDMLKMPLSTVDTHIRDINVVFRQFVGAVESGELVQASWLGEFHEVSAMGRAKVQEVARGREKKRGA